MLLAFPIDFIRQALEQTLEEEHFKKPSIYFGGKNEVALYSFYEQFEKQEEVDRFVEVYRDLSNQANRTGIILNGVIVSPENPTITNINNADIIPMSFTCNFRTTLANRDNAIRTINNLIRVLKGRKVDIAEFDDGRLLKVGTIGNNVNGSPLISNGDFLGTITNADSSNTDVSNIIIDLQQKGFVIDENYPKHFYVEDLASGTLKVVYKEDENSNYIVLENDLRHKDIVFPTEHKSFTKFKVSLSFDSIRCDEPRTLNSEEYCTISFGGSATLVNEKVLLGNDLTKLSFIKYMVKGREDIMLDENISWLEPLELPSSNSANAQAIQLMSKKFFQNSHNDAFTISLQYTFVMDTSNDLLVQLYDYARYGIYGSGSTKEEYENSVSPNMIYKVSEYWVSWGIAKIKTFYAKIAESIDIENTESDTLTITIPIQVQGANV